MSHWNRAYLDALEVPVWVPLNDQAEESTNPKVEPSESRPQATSASADAVKVEAEEAAESNIDSAPNIEGDFIRILQGEASADFVFVIPKSADPASCKASIRQLELAWKAWLDQPFTAAIAQLSEQSEHAQSVESCRGKIILCGSELTSFEHPSIQAPSLDALQSQKKEWWSLLQRLH